MLGDEAWLSFSVPIHPRGVGRGLCTGQSRSPTPSSENIFFMDPAFMYWGIVMLKQKKCLHQTVATKSEAHYFLIACCNITAKSSLIGAKEPSP